MRVSFVAKLLDDIICQEFYLGFIETMLEDGHGAATVAYGFL